MLFCLSDPIRPSGTEAMIRIMIEGQDLPFMQQKADEIAAVMARNLSRAR